MQNNNYKEWLKKAEEDERSASAILRGKDGSPSTVCFLSQQMAEKYLKGLMVFHGVRFPKMHDLLELATLLLEKETDVGQLTVDLNNLNSYYIETRYPGNYPEFAWADAEMAFVAASKIKEFVLLKAGLN
jgi:HEPN domain-containing protein